jgi:hypothetical protein
LNSGRIRKCQPVGKPISFEIILNTVVKKELENVLVSGVAKYNRTNLLYFKSLGDKF